MIEKRIPKEETINMLAWSAPVLGSSGAVLSSHEKQLKDGKSERIQHLSAYVQNGRLTGDVLEKLHQQIYEEGLAKGQAEGYKTGYEQGFSKGELSGSQAGYLAGKQKAELEAKRLEELFELIFEPLQQQHKNIENWILQSVKDICLGVMQHECQTDENILMPFIKEAVGSLSAGSKKTSVKLHPDDIALVNKFVQQKSLNWNVISDAELLHGDCYVYTDDAVVDYTLSARVDQALQAMVATEVREENDVAIHQ